MATDRGVPLFNKDNTVDDGTGDEKTAADNFKDNGWAWLACFLSVLDQIFIAGFLNAFGVFFVEFINEFNSSKAQTALLGSLCYGFMKLFSPLTSIVVKQFSNRTAMMTGLFICVISVYWSSHVNDIRLMLVTMPLVYGLGCSLIINPLMMLPNTYFERHKGLATGLVCAGSSVGTIVMSLTSQSLVGTVGWRITFRIYSAVFLFLAVSNAMIIPVPKDKKRQPLESIRNPVLKNLISDLKLWKNRVFILWATATSLVMFGCYVPMVHFVQFALDNGISGRKAALIMVLFGFSTTLSRVTSGKILEYGFVNQLHLDQLVMVVTGTAFMILPYLTTFSSLAAYALIVGLFDGCYVVLMPLLTYSLIGAENATMAWGYMCLTSSVTLALGPPTAGFLYDTYGNYNIAFHCAGIPIIMGAVILFFIPWAQRTSQSDNVMAVLSDLECGDGHNIAEPSFSSTSHTGRQQPEVVRLPFLIDSHSADNQFLRYRVNRTTAPSVSLPANGRARELHSAKTSRSETTPGKYEFPERYLDQLRSQMTSLVIESALSIPDPSSPGTLQMGETPRLHTSFTSTASLALEQLVQEHIELFLADLVSRRIPVLSVSNLSNSLAVRSSLVCTADLTEDGNQCKSQISPCNLIEQHRFEVVDQSEHHPQHENDESTRSEQYHMHGQEIPGHSKHHMHDMTQHHQPHGQDEHHLLHGEYHSEQGLSSASRTAHSLVAAGGSGLCLSSLSCNSVKLTRIAGNHALWTHEHSSTDSQREDDSHLPLCSISFNSARWEADNNDDSPIERNRSHESVITEESREIDMFQHLFTDDDS